MRKKKKCKKKIVCLPIELKKDIERLVKNNSKYNCKTHFVECAVERFLKKVKKKCKK